MSKYNIEHNTHKKRGNEIIKFWLDCFDRGGTDIDRDQARKGYKETIEKMDTEEDRHLLAMIDNDKVIGTVLARLCPFKKDETYKYKIDYVATKEEYREEGIASILLDKIDEVTGHKEHWLYAEMEKPYSIQFYLNRGFSFAGYNGYVPWISLKKDGKGECPSEVFDSVKSVLSGNWY